MSSKLRNSSPEETTWRAAGLRYYRVSCFFRQKFGHRVWKVSVDGGLGCPNVDGTLGTGGCIFCNVRSYSPSRRLSTLSVTEQIDEAVRRLRRRYGVDHFVAYFQPGTNTYGPVERLRRLWEEALRHSQVVGLVIGTRPDCVPNEVLDLLAEFSRRTWLTVEYGVQTMHDRSLDWLHRGHRHAASVDAILRSRQRGLRIGAHVILGLPCESRDDMLATAGELARLKVDSVKLHNLYAANETTLAQMLDAGQFKLPERDQYVACVVDFLERLPPDCVVDRLSADVPREYLISPSWCIDKAAVGAAIEGELQRRNTWQGCKCVQTA